jgi:hypothetical protein
MVRFLCLLTALMSIGWSAQSASINGHALRFEWVFGDDVDDISSNMVSGNYTVGTDVQTIYFGTFRIGVSDNQVRINWIDDSDLNPVNTYNGLKLTDAFGLVPEFLLFHQASASGVSGIQTEFGPEFLFVNLAGTGPVASGSSALFEFRLSDTVPRVPLPAALPLLLVGIGGLGLVRRRAL